MSNPVAQTSRVPNNLRFRRTFGRIKKIVEFPNRIQAKHPAVIVVHPWGIDDKNGWNSPEPAGVALCCTPEKNRIYNRHVAEIILFCANHITIGAHTEGKDMYVALDETIDKIARRMRKHKTRLLKKHRPHRNESIRYLEERFFTEEVLDHPEESEIDPVPYIIHPENYSIRTMYKEDAIMQLELSDRPFVLYKSARRGCLTIVYRRKDGDYAALDIKEGDL